ncbi:MAG: ABC transporter substrate-binding protein [Candidatus Binatia bacterium]
MQRIFVLVWTLVWLFSADFLTGGEAPKYGGRLVLGIRNDISGLNPFVRTSSTNVYVRQLMYEALLDFDKDGKLVPSLAESWTVSADGKSYLFKLRNGVTFHDGKELTAEDVKWSVDYAMDPNNGATGLRPLKSVERVSVKDRLTVEFVLKNPHAGFLSMLGTIRPFPIVSKGSVSGAKGDVSRFPPGTGPFAFKDYKPAREIAFVRNKNYWRKGLPYLDELILKPVLEDQVRFTGVRAGDLDIIERAPYSFIAKVLRGEYPDLKISESKHAGYRRLLFNVVEPPFNDVRLRQAVRYAVDKRKYIDGAFWGLGEPADQLFPVGSPWRAKLPEIKPDPSKVKALLKDAGVAPDWQAELIGQKSEEEELQVIQQQLTSAGIRTKVTILERGARVTRERSGDFMMVLSGGDIPDDPAEEFQSEFGCAEEQVRAKKRTENSSGYCNKEVDRHLVAAIKASDVKQRHESYSKIIRSFHDDVVDISLAYVPRYFVFQQKVVGFETDDDGRFSLPDGGVSRVWLAR